MELYIPDEILLKIMDYGITLSLSIVSKRYSILVYDFAEPTEEKILCYIRKDWANHIEYLLKNGLEFNWRVNKWVIQSENNRIVKLFVDYKYQLIINFESLNFIKSIEGEAIKNFNICGKYMDHNSLKILQCDITNYYKRCLRRQKYQKYQKCVIILQLVNQLYGKTEH